MCDHRIENVISRFIDGVKVSSVKELGGGAINRTYLAETDRGAFIVQSMNAFVFGDRLYKIEQNYRAFAEALNEARASEEITLEVPEWILTADGRYFWKEPDGTAWRVYPFIEGKPLRIDEPDVLICRYQAPSSSGVNIAEEQNTISEPCPDIVKDKPADSEMTGEQGFDADKDRAADNERIDEQGFDAIEVFARALAELHRILEHYRGKPEDVIPDFHRIDLYYLSYQDAVAKYERDHPDPARTNSYNADQYHKTSRAPEEKSVSENTDSSPARTDKEINDRHNNFTGSSDAKPDPARADSYNADLYHNTSRALEEKLFLGNSDTSPARSLARTTEERLASGNSDSSLTCKDKEIYDRHNNIASSSDAKPDPASAPRRDSFCEKLITENIDYIMNCCVAGGGSVIHGDTKIENVLFDVRRGKAAFIDLDTISAGTPLIDIADSVRSILSNGADRTDSVRSVLCNGGDSQAPAGTDIADSDRYKLSCGGDRACSSADQNSPVAGAASGGSPFQQKAAVTGSEIDIRVARRFIRAYYDAAGRAPSPEETESLRRTIIRMPFELGLRFYTDHLRGDTYFPVDRPDQNLVRARRQFSIFAALCAELTELRL